MSQHTVIVGGGLAGLAAATALADRGVAVTLLESRPRLGGRASSFTDQATGTQIDNCQHVSMGCCTNFQKFCDQLNLTKLLRPQRELYFVGPDGVINTMAVGRLPAPLHLLPSLWRLSYLDRHDLSGIARGMRALARPNAAESNGETFASWLNRYRQTPAAIERFWHVVLVSALSETLERIDVAAARKVFLDAFLAHRRGWEVQIPAVPLDDLYGSHIPGWIEKRGGTVRMQAGVKRLQFENGAVSSVELRSGEHLSADDYVLAVPQHLVLSLLPEEIRDLPEFAGIAHLESAPITSVHLWFDREITPLPHAVLVERLSQWMFNRSALQQSNEPPGELNANDARRETDDGYYYQIVISASRSLEGRAQQDVIDEVVGELAAIWPATREATLLHGRLVTEHKAVFSVQPGSEGYRPLQQSPIENLQLAGDWTKTGWPATMEGAVRSGYLAAENILSRLGRPERLIEADLPVAPLSKILLGM